METSAAEGDVGVGLTRQIECVRAIEHLGVAIARGIHHHHLVSRQDALPVELVFGDRGTPGVQHHRSPAQELFDRRVDAALEFFPQPLALVWKLRERLDSEAGCVAGGVGGCDSEKDHHGADFGVGQLLTIDLGLHQIGQQVLGWRLAPLRDELRSDLVNLRCRLDLHLGAVAPGQQDRIRPRRHHLVGGVRGGRPQLLWDTEHVAEHFDRQVRGTSPTKSIGSPAAAFSRAEATILRARDAMSSSMRRIWGRVNALPTSPRTLSCCGLSMARERHRHLQKHRRKHVEHDAVARHEYIGVLTDFDDVGVAHHGPEARIVLLRVQRCFDRPLPADRPLLSQLLENQIPLLDVLLPERVRGDVEVVVGPGRSDVVGRSDIRVVELVM